MGSYHIHKPTQNQKRVLSQRAWQGDWLAQCFARATKEIPMAKWRQESIYFAHSTFFILPLSNICLFFKINDPIHAYYIVQATARICSERKLSLEASYTARLIKEMIF